MLRKKLHKEFRSTVTVTMIAIFLSVATALYIIYHSIYNPTVPENTLVYDKRYYTQSRHPGCHIIQLGAFTIETPKTFRYIKRSGYDSYIGEITNQQDTLYFDYGMYSYNFENETSMEHTFRAESINGKLATIVRPKKKSRGLTGIYIQNVSGNNHLVISGYDLVDEETVISMFKTIKFPKP